jgi:uncharacterized membrane protein
MPDRDVDLALHVVHDLTQSIWLGGALMGAVSIDAAASAATDDRSRTEGVDRAWRRWHRISTPAIAAHLVAGVGLTVANKGRLTAQRGGMRTVLLRSALTGAALASEVAARKVGQRIGERSTQVETAPDTVGVRDEELEKLERRLTLAQWATVATTAAMIGVGARMEEQQRPRELLRGVASRLGLAA